MACTSPSALAPITLMGKLHGYWMGESSDGAGFAGCNGMVFCLVNAGLVLLLAVLAAQMQLASVWGKLNDFQAFECFAGWRVAQVHGFEGVSHLRAYKQVALGFVVGRHDGPRCPRCASCAKQGGVGVLVLAPLLARCQV